MRPRLLPILFILGACFSCFEASALRSTVEDEVPDKATSEQKAEGPKHQGKIRKAEEQRESQRVQAGLKPNRMRKLHVDKQAFVPKIIQPGKNEASEQRSSETLELPMEEGEEFTEESPLEFSDMACPCECTDCPECCLNKKKCQLKGCSLNCSCPLHVPPVPPLPKKHP
ncbi:MAG: hypothetical protein HOI80_03755 [Alphaproteobacteria bacterium]|jgi:hypothetical protein|nr:hypothetical protein [Alphaproteobacteria bacterium]MBT5390310.1 hypothetical protein [Alphaproteobacteria bacterium]MBT5540290.1 hypothetical protein [Alphaproteobacteria bacterium]MBT5654600.1 hypothetical protein [Alphaproteobacteria bacterium]